MVFFRTDANEKLATGHMMRCITIATECIKRGMRVCFFISNEVSATLLQHNKIDYIILNTSWENLNYELEMKKMSEFLDKIKMSVLFIDLPTCSEKYVNEMKKHFKVVCMDDLALNFLPADILINYNLFYDRFNYEVRYKQENTKLLLGAEYVPIREQFKEKKMRNFNKEPKNILVICGGGDQYNFLGQYMKWMEQNSQSSIQEYEWNIVCGKYNTYINYLKQIETKYKSVHVFEYVDNMADIMKNVDICVTAASTVLYECCASLLPTVFFVVSDDQIYDVDEFSKNDIMFYCGDFRKKSEIVYQRIIENIGIIKQNIYRKETMIKMKLSNIDAFGTERIVDAIEKLETEGGKSC